MPITTVHQGKSVDVGPFTVYAHFDAADPTKNVVDPVAVLTVSCPSGAARVGLLPDGRTVFVDGLTATAAPVNIALSVPGVTSGFLVSVLASNSAPPAIETTTGVSVSPEYDTPMR